jgi:hypothetical protein
MTPLDAAFSATEFVSLQEVGRGIGHGGIRESHAARLAELGFIHKLLGSLLITIAAELGSRGTARIAP